MKKFVSIFCFIIAFIAIGIPCVKAQGIILKNGDEQIAKILKTTDSNYHYIDSISVKANETGIIEASVIGFDTANINAITGIISKF